MEPPLPGIGCQWTECRLIACQLTGCLWIECPSLACRLIPWTLTARQPRRMTGDTLQSEVDTQWIQEIQGSSLRIAEDFPLTEGLATRLRIHPLAMVVLLPRPSRTAKILFTLAMVDILSPQTRVCRPDLSGKAITICPCLPLSNRQYLPGWTRLHMAEGTHTLDRRSHRGWKLVTHVTHAIPETREILGTRAIQGMPEIPGTRGSARTTNRIPGMLTLARLPPCPP